jgi:NADPH-dependent 2,4-dienoyl-CoA reductase/sulfur reductase-like enzyme
MTNDGFIRVNQRLETSIEHVLAVGDICKYPLRVFNLDDVNCQHWQMACSTGHQAGRYLLSTKESQQFGDIRKCFLSQFL